MASRNFPTSSNFASERTSLEEVRRNHLRPVQQRMRFCNNTIDDRCGENPNTNNNNSAKRPDFTIHQNSFHTLGHHRSCNQNEVTSQSNNFQFDQRRCSIASYQPLCIPQIFIPVYYSTNNGPALPQVQIAHTTVHQGCLRKPEINTEHTELDDSDDVFISSTNSDFGTGAMPVVAAHDKTAYIPRTLQQMQRRKRARSAGDMIGLSIISDPPVVYPKVPVELGGAETGLPIVNSASSAHLPFSETNSVCFYPLPKKRPVTNKSNLSGGLKMLPIQVLPLNAVTCSELKDHADNPSMSETLKSDDSPSSFISLSSQNVKSITCINPSGTLNHKLIHDTIGSAASIEEISRQSTIIENDTHSSQDSSYVRSMQTAVSHQKSTLKNASLLKPSNKKKKVGWNDTAETNEKDSCDGLVPTVGVDQKKDEDICSVDIDALKVDPFNLTSKNKIGPYLIGPKLGNCSQCPVTGISQYMVRKAGTNKYYMAKILSITESDARCGKMLLHTEHSLLSLLASQPGVVHHHGMFKDFFYDSAKGKVYKRVGLILDCLTPHEFDPSSQYYLNLQQYVVQMKHLSEQEIIRIFYSILTVVNSLHKNNVIHRDLKLSNMVLDKRTRRVTLTNFCLGCHLTREQDLLTDQRGSPAYISPDILRDKPCAGKPADMWSLGVVLFTMLYKHFPFYDQEPKKLYAKIKAADYTIPSDIKVSAKTIAIIRGLLTLNPAHRLTASEALAAVQARAVIRRTLRLPTAPAQVVPDITSNESKISEAGETQPTTSDADYEEKLTRTFQQKMLSDDEDDKETTSVTCAAKRKTCPGKQMNPRRNLCHASRNSHQHHHIRSNRTLVSNTVSTHRRQLTAQ